ncbi:hypothetical protein MKK84_11385 [Methylobacterium sp. E-065]|uniref:hypothetical protein n=1 Tax=Methylobacterium sp. E-065 TaxID=2836583 RepID=UPI001FBB3A4C|nr:hypothetical protein [Methylobacterium sp. E-065]MCJ2018022.1 hypothetical protein [Methylobacterium sp. E-065]
MNTIEHDQPRRRGRPGKAADERKSANMKFRTREDLREKIEAAAADAGRSASEEVEARLLNSFNVEPLHHMVFGNGDDARRLITNILTAIKTVQDYENPIDVKLGTVDWRGEDPLSDFTRAALRNAFSVIISQALPPPRAPDQLPFSDEQRKVYERALNHMKAFGIEFAELITGQRPNLAEALNSAGDPEH